ncbi:hypothetical protein DIPPA_11969 [Diplonema papillatum]|nr:hypothetical protein DIPPA_11969 [Diplonema papillatum]
MHIRKYFALCTNDRPIAPIVSIIEPHGGTVVDRHLKGEVDRESNVRSSNVVLAFPTKQNAERSHRALTERGYTYKRLKTMRSYPEAPLRGVSILHCDWHCSHELSVSEIRVLTTEVCKIIGASWRADEYKCVAAQTSVEVQPLRVVDGKHKLRIEQELLKTFCSKNKPLLDGYEVTLDSCSAYVHTLQLGRTNEIFRSKKDGEQSKNWFTVIADRDNRFIVVDDDVIVPTPAAEAPAKAVSARLSCYENPSESSELLVGNLKGCIPSIMTSWNDTCMGANAHIFNNNHTDHEQAATPVVRAYCAAAPPCRVCGLALPQYDNEKTSPVYYCLHCRTSNWITAPQETFCASPANQALRRANVPTVFDVTRLSPQFMCSNTMCTASTASAELDNSCKASPPSPQLDGTVASGKTTLLSTPGTPPSCASSRRVRRVLNKVSLEKLDICAADLSAVVIESLKEGRSDVADCVYRETFPSRGYAHVFAELYYKVCKAEASDLKASRFKAIMLEHLQNDFMIVLQSPDLEAAMMPAASAFSQKAISELAVASKTADGSIDCFKTEAVALVKFLAALHSVSLVGSREVVDCVADLLTKVEETFVTSAKTVTPFASMLVETVAACLESIAWDKISSVHDLSKASSDIQSRVTALSKCSCFRLSVLLENALSAMN